MSPRTATAERTRGTTTRTTPASAPGRRPTAARRPGLRLVTTTAPRARAQRLPFVLVVSGLLTTALVGLLLLNTFSAQDAFRIHDLQRRNAALAQQAQQLALDVAKDNSPLRLLDRAGALGLRPGTIPSYHRLRDGRVIGTIVATAPRPAPAPVVHPTPKPAHRPKASAHRRTASATRAPRSTASATSRLAHRHKHRTQTVSGAAH